MTRVKKTTKPVKSEAEMEGVVSKYAIAHAAYERTNKAMGVRITAIRTTHEETLNGLKAEMEEHMEDMEAFAKANPEKFKTAKSIDYVHGTIGFRTGTPKVQQLRKLTWKEILELCKKKLKPYVRVKEELDKQSLIADREKKEVKKQLEFCGIEIVQEETFFVDLKKEGE